MSMIDKVARAVAIATNPAMANDQMWENNVLIQAFTKIIATAAIEAMREPTGEMIVNLKADMLAGALPLRAYKNLLDKALEEVS